MNATGFCNMNVKSLREVSVKELGDMNAVELRDAM